MFTFLQQLLRVICLNRYSSSNRVDSFTNSDLNGIPVESAMHCIFSNYFLECTSKSSFNFSRYFVPLLEIIWFSFSSYHKLEMYRKISSQWLFEKKKNMKSLFFYLRAEQDCLDLNNCYIFTKQTGLQIEKTVLIFQIITQNIINSCKKLNSWRIWQVLVSWLLLTITLLQYLTRIGLPFHHLFFHTASQIDENQVVVLPFDTYLWIVMQLVTVFVLCFFFLF